MVILKQNLNPFDVKITTKGANCHINAEKAFVKTVFFNIFNSASRIFEIISRKDSSHP